MEAIEKKYMTTREQCAERIFGVCAGCGGELVPLETVDNSGNPTFWAGCEVCSVFDNGVSKLTFEIAKKMVTECNHIAYSHLDRPDNKDEAYKKYWLSSQIRGTVYTVIKVLALREELTDEK
jgi:hypothetical protein